MQLNAMSVPTARGGRWYGKTVLNAANRLWGEVHKKMIGKFLKSASGIAVGLVAVLTLLVMFFTEPPYSQE
jgi:hypothetical protein